MLSLLDLFNDMHYETWAGIHLLLLLLLLMLLLRGQGTLSSHQGADTEVAKEPTNRFTQFSNATDIPQSN